MLLHAIVYTTHDQPNTPRLAAAEDAAAVDANPDALHQGIADLLLDEHTRRVSVVNVEVSDDVVLGHLDGAPPAVAGTVQITARRP